MWCDSDGQAIEYTKRLEAEQDALALALLPTWQQKKELGGRSYKLQNYTTALELYTDAIKLLEGEEGSEGLAGELAGLYNNRSACYRALEMHQEVTIRCYLGFSGSYR